MYNSPVDNDNWNNNAYQFPRLLAEIRANVEVSDKEWQDICDSMDINEVELEQLWNRALQEWEDIKAKVCPSNPTAG